ncbi:MAG: hypothetical protein IJS90_09195 [Clostridia bacterium]|nr:hypothetical protein [Clostridia bacterium]
MKKRRSISIFVLAVFVLCLCSCSFGQSVYFLFFGSNRALTSLDGQVLQEPDFVDYSVSRVLYSALTPLQQQAYRLVYNSVFSHKSKIQIPKISQSELMQVMLALRGDNPHMLCLSREYTYYDGVKSCYVLPDYAFDASECAEKTNELISAAKKIIASLPQPADEFIKELYLHNALCEECSYSDEPFSDSAYCALVDGKARCEGYSMAFKLLLDMAGITATVVRGSAENTKGLSEAHMWNAVKLGSAWYFTDVTWDDPVTNTGLPGLRHSYFNVNEKELSKTHSGYNLPAGMIVSGGKYDYFVRTGLCCEEGDWRETVGQKISEAASLSGAHLEFKFESSVLLDEVRRELFANGELRDIVSSLISVESFSCSYSADPDVNVLHIYLDF